MTEICIEVASSLRVEGFEKSIQRKASKLAVASAFLFFFQRTSCGEGSNTNNVSSLEYSQLIRLDLLSEIEAAELKAHSVKLGGSATPSLIVLAWAMQLLRRMTENPECRDDMLCAMYARLYQIRQCQISVEQIMSLPMPFQYFHIMNLMLVLNLIFWAYSLGCEDSFFAPFIYMFVQMMYQGIRELSTALSDPFGDDAVDFPVNKWLASLYSSMYGVLEDRMKPSDLTIIGGPTPAAAELSAAAGEQNVEGKPGRCEASQGLPLEDSEQALALRRQEAPGCAA
eukprot:CAMPEP_0117510918 /NCGR_PEP_ID=MMETSP0784-20121206/28238_1 /TAXON_ID=39447 /ORGANISM="" /LENGTH=283 /DNA_ID=CAMNT_0005306571 /DNA_START=314 /DNA_END=1164 /DNA_ORIENTATION=+